MLIYPRNVCNLMTTYISGVIIFKNVSKSLIYVTSLIAEKFLRPVTFPLHVLKLQRGKHEQNKAKIKYTK